MPIEPLVRLLQILSVAPAMFNITPLRVHGRFAMICTGYSTVAGAIYSGKCYIDTVSDELKNQSDVRCHELKNQSDTAHLRQQLEYQLEAKRQSEPIRPWWKFWRPIV